MFDIIVGIVLFGGSAALCVVAAYAATRTREVKSPFAIPADYAGKHRDYSIEADKRSDYADDMLSIHGDADFYKGVHRKYQW